MISSLSFWSFFQVIADTHGFFFLLLVCGLLVDLLQLTSFFSFIVLERLIFLWVLDLLTLCPLAPPRVSISVMPLATCTISRELVRRNMNGGTTWILAKNLFVSECHFYSCQDTECWLSHFPSPLFTSFRTSWYDKKDFNEKLFLSCCSGRVASFQMAVYH